MEKKMLNKEAVVHNGQVTFSGTALVNGHFYMIHYTFKGVVVDGKISNKVEDYKGEETVYGHVERFPSQEIAEANRKHHLELATR